MHLTKHVGHFNLGLPGPWWLQNTGHWHCQFLWHKTLSYLHMHCPVLLSYFQRTKNQNTGQSG